MALVGPRPDTPEGWAVVDPDIRAKILSVKPGMFGISGLLFFDEEKLLALGGVIASELYWTKIRPMKFILDSFYVDNKSWSLDLVLIYLGIKTVIKEYIKHGRNI